MVAGLGRDSFDSSYIDIPSTDANPTMMGEAREVIRMDEPGPCGKRLSIEVNPEVEIAYVTIPRRAHMRRRSSAEGREGDGRVSDGPPEEIPDRVKWNDTCLAIRDAGNLAIEVGSPLVSTNSLIPKTHKHCEPLGDLTPCIRNSAIDWEAIPVAGPDSQLRSPVLWYDGADMVFHYPFNPWVMADAVERKDKAAIGSANEPVLYSTDHALHEFSGSDCFWHFDSHLTPDVPRLRIPDPENDDNVSTVSDAIRADLGRPIGVLIEYCCSQDSILCDEQFEDVDGQKVVLIRLTEKHDMASKEDLDYAMILINRYKDLPMFLWSSIPCTGGSTAQRRNKHRRGHDARMEKHYRLFKKLHHNLMILAGVVVEETVDGHFVFEWPYPNDWWQL